MSTGVFNKTVGDLVRESLRSSTISGIELPVQASDFAQGFVALNNLLAAWQAKQIHVWSEEEAIMPLNSGQQKYVFGVDHIFSEYTYSTVAAVAYLSQSYVDLSSVIGMSIGDYIGIELSNGIRHWAQISSIVDSDVYFDIPLPEEALLGASVYAYTVKSDLPVRILGMRYADSHTADELPTWQISRQEYYDQNSKGATGAVNQWYYSRQLSNPYLNVWPTANSCRNVLRISFIRPQYVAEDQSENVQVPPEWYNAIKWQLAADLGIVYNIDSNRQVMLEQKAQISLADAIGSDTDYSSLNFTPVCHG